MGRLVENAQIAFVCLTVSGVLPAMAVTAVESFDFGWLPLLIGVAVLAFAIYLLVSDETNPLEHNMGERREVR